MARARQHRGARSGSGALARAVACALLLGACDRPVAGGEPEALDFAGSSVEPAAPSPAADPPAGGAGDTDARADWTPPPLPERPPAPAPPGPEQAGRCPGQRGEADDALGVLVLPQRPVVGERVRVIGATLAGEEALAMRIEDASGSAVAAELVHRRGVPAATVATLTPTRSGTLRVVVGRAGKGLRCVELVVRAGAGPVAPPTVDLAAAPAAWEVERSWRSSEEALYSAWVRELFHGPEDADLAWTRLDEVTSDAQRNLLHDYLGWREDSRGKGLSLGPDCADTPYFLRAYYAWKRGLPFGFMKCSRGRGEAPRCFSLRTNLDPADLSPAWTREVDPEPADRLGLAQRFFSRTLAWGVHTGNGRVAHDDARNDFYPVALERRSLRPGVIYADPYGHILVVSELVEGGAGRPGILFAIDGQPDGSITRKRFWEGNFLWNPDPSLGGSGFKAFRPLVEARRVDPEQPRELVQVDNQGLASFSVYQDFSLAQGALTGEEFYDLMERTITPGVRDPQLAQAEAIAAFAEAARVRMTSVNNGVEWARMHPNEEIEMPDGHAVFETQGAWENFSTPARDLRLLIAIDLIAGFDAKLRRQPQAFGFASAEEVDAAAPRLRRQREQLLASPAHAVSYRRSDGSEWRLTLAELMRRQVALEVAYNPNDCPELRWGAVEGSEEMATCTRRTGPAQRAKMEAYRRWFHARQRPARGDDGPEVPEAGEP